MLDYAFLDDAPQLCEVNNIARVLRHTSFYCHLQHVVVAVPVGIIAFAECRLVPGVGLFWIMQAVGGVKCCLTCDVDGRHGCAAWGAWNDAFVRRFRPNIPALVVMSRKTLFERIADREISARIVYEDALCIAFRDIAPKAPVHVLVVPRRPLASIAEAEDTDKEMLGHLLVVAKLIADQERLKAGYRLVINAGEDGGQTVEHLHIHLLGGRRLGWPPG